MKNAKKSRLKAFSPKRNICSNVFQTVGRGRFADVPQDDATTCKIFLAVLPIGYMIIVLHSSTTKF